jgi:glycosyltransferase involved in cell wall biosynthesis
MPSPAVPDRPAIVPRDETSVPAEKLPLVSILTPSLNQAAFLPDNLRSVQCQSYAAIEHIVMDGASTDDSVEVLRNAGDSVRWRSEPDEGQSDAVNKAFRESRGEIIGWLNSDDAYFDCHVVDDVVACFRSHPDVDVAYGHSLQTTGDGRAIQVLWAPRFDPELQKAVNLQVQPSSFMRRRALSDPLLDTSFHFAMDYELWLRLASRGLRFGRIDRILSIDRHQLERKSATIKGVYLGDLERLATMYGLHLGPEFDRQRATFYRRQRLMGALLIPTIHAGKVAFTPSPDLKAGLWRRQIGSRRADWPDEFK